MFELEKRLLETMHMAPKLHAVHDFSRHCRSQDLGMIRCARIRKDSARQSCLVRAQDNAATELFESALLLASPSERHLHEEWKRRDEGHPSSEVLYTSKFLDIPELCKATRLAFCKDQGLTPISMRMLPASSVPVHLTIHFHFMRYLCWWSLIRH